VTRGEPSVREVLARVQRGAGDESDDAWLLRLAASAERRSEHPVGAAVVQEAKARGLGLSEPETFMAVPGRGVVAGVDGHDMVIGTRRLLEERGIDLNGLEPEARRMETAVRTPLWVGVDGVAVGLLGVADAVKDGSRAAVEDLRSRGLRVVMLTGDNQSTAEAIAREVGIDEVRAEVLPDQKVDVVRELQEGGALVAMVGDGINDAPALVQADVGIAIGTGADVAMEAADVTLMHGDLRSVPQALALSRATMRTIKQNLFWAFFYNVVLIPVAAGALYPITALPLMLRSLHPILAALAMAFSSVSVVGNSLRLRKARL
jgi:Cu+-exporting ATPase